ncbi:MAG: hypothetical protein QM820_46315 [Minicystis sp.]
MPRLHPASFAPREIRAVEPGAGEHGAREVRAAQVAAGEIGAFEEGLAEADAAEVEAVEVDAGEVALLEADAALRARGQLDPRAFRQRRVRGCRLVHAMRVLAVHVALGFLGLTQLRGEIGVGEAGLRRRVRPPRASGLGHEGAHLLDLFPRRELRGTRSLTLALGQGSVVITPGGRERGPRVGLGFGARILRVEPQLLELLARLRLQGVVISGGRDRRLLERWDRLGKVLVGVFPARGEALALRLQLSRGLSVRVPSAKRLRLRPQVRISKLVEEHLGAGPGRHQVALADGCLGGLLHVEPLLQDGAEVLDGAERAGRVAGRDEVEDVRRVVLDDRRDASVEHDHRERVGVELERVHPHGHLAELAPAQVHERPGNEARHPAFEHGAGRVHVLQGERLVTLEVPVEPLIPRRGVEELEVEVERQAGILVLAPGAVVGADLRVTLRPHQIEGRESDGRGPLARRSDEAPRVLDVRERVHLAGRGLHRCEPFADGIVREPRPTKRVRPAHGHRRERDGIRRDAGRAPGPIADHPEGLVDPPEGQADRAGDLGRAARVRAPHDDDLGDRLRPAEVHRDVRPEVLREELPEVGLVERALGRVERRGEHRGDAEAELPARLEGAHEHAELLRLDGLHDRAERSEAGVWGRLRPHRDRGVTRTW